MNRTNLEQRRKIQSLAASGEKSPAIAKELNLSVWTVRKWRQRLNKGGALHSKMGRPVSGYLSSFPSELRERIKTIRKAEAGWGASSILVELKRKYAYTDKQLPGRKSVALFLKQEGFVKTYERHSDLPDAERCDQPEEAHELWQLDARGNEVVQMASEEDPEQSVALLDIKDVFSLTYVCCFPAPMVSQQGHPGTKHYQSALRLAFLQHGMPKAIQTDNASVFRDNRSKSPFPTKLHLWLVGLGIRLCHSRVHQPTDQAVVERSHEVLYNQILKGDKTFRNWEHLYEKCQERRQVLNNDIPSRSCEGQAPLVAQPQAGHSQRMYHPHKELDLIDMTRVDNYLANCKWYRKVAANKIISLAGQLYYLPLAQPKEQLEITFCSKCRYLLFQNDKEQLIAIQPIKGMDEQYLMGEMATIFTMPALQLPIPFEWQDEVSMTLLHAA